MQSTIRLVCFANTTKHHADIQRAETMMKIALIGQAAFGKAVLEAITGTGKDEVVGVFATPDVEGRPRDPLAEAADASGIPLFQFKRMRNAEAIEQFKSLAPDLCVMAFVTDIVPMDMINAPAQGTIQYHPSLLPLHRGPSSINWPIVQGETQTGPVLLQKTTEISPTDTLGTVYFQRLFPMGVDAMVEAIELVRSGNAPRITQDESKATYEGWFGAKEAVIDWSKAGADIFNLVRGSDPSPGANTTINGTSIGLYDASFSRQAQSSPHGSIVVIGEKSIDVAVGGGTLSVGRVRTRGGAKNSAAEFVRSTGVGVGDQFGT
jgi:methionyl-tRNA formyltransferase